MGKKTDIAYCEAVSLGAGMYIFKQGAFAAPMRPEVKLLNTNPNLQSASHQKISTGSLDTFRKSPLNVVTFSGNGLQCRIADMNIHQSKSPAELAQVILNINPDILVLQEVNRRSELIEFNQRYLNNNYSEIITFKEDDSAGMQVAILAKSNFKVIEVKRHSISGVPASRGILEVTFQLPTGHQLTLYAVHFRAMKVWRGEITHQYRLKEARAVAKLLKKRTPDELFAVIGDCNDFPHSDVINMIKNASKPPLIEVLQGTKTYHGNPRCPSAKLDYILLSPALAKLLANAFVAANDVASDHDLTGACMEFPEQAQQLCLTA